VSPSEYQIINETQLEEVAQEEEVVPAAIQSEPTPKVTEALILEKVTDSSVDLGSEAKQARSQSMDELISDHSADFSAKNCKLAILKSLSLRESQRRKSTGSKMVSIE